MYASSMHLFSDNSQFNPYAFISYDYQSILHMKNEEDWWEECVRPHFGWAKCKHTIFVRLISSEKNRASVIFSKNPFNRNTYREDVYTDVIIRRKIGFYT